MLFYCFSWYFFSQARLIARGNNPYFVILALFEKRKINREDTRMDAKRGKMGKKQKEKNKNLCNLRNLWFQNTFYISTKM
jgi:hypothetical protein